MRRESLLGYLLIFAVVGLAACSSKPGTDSLHESFVNQLRANRFVKELERSGDDIRFTGPGANGVAVQPAGRVHLDGDRSGQY